MYLPRQQQTAILLVVQWPVWLTVLLFMTKVIDLILVLEFDRFADSIVNFGLCKHL